MNIGYIMRSSSKDTLRFRLMEAPFTRRISSKGDRIYSKILYGGMNYEEIVSNAEIMKNYHVILIQEPFLLDDELRGKVTRWVDWANKADPKVCDAFEE